MTRNRKGVGLMIAATVILIACGIFYLLPSPQEDPIVNETMTIDLYIQDKEAAIASDCTVTTRVTREIPQTEGVADASLRILFAEELAQYATYGSVAISDSVARVMLSNENDPNGYRIGSLSSCQGGHLMAVLNDTLTQYDTIDSVELYTENGKIEF